MKKKKEKMFVNTAQRIGHALDTHVRYIERIGDTLDLEWIHKGSWCDLVDTYISSIETKFNDRLSAIDRAFRLPSVLS